MLLFYANYSLMHTCCGVCLVIYTVYGITEQYKSNLIYDRTTYSVLMETSIIRKTLTLVLQC